jgi:hypothetical protein
MDAQDVVDLLRLTQGQVVANHLEALRHCPVTRTGLAQAATQAGMQARLHVPADGETLTFHEAELLVVVE